MKAYKKQKINTIVCAVLSAYATIAQAQTYTMLRALHVERLSYIEEPGKIAGFESDLVAEIEKRAGIEFKSSVATTFQQGFDDVKKGAADIIIGAITITEERKQSYLFSEPEPITIVTKADNVKSIEDLKDKKVSVLSGSTHEEWIKKFQETHPDVKVEKVPSTFLGIKEVIQGKADATINNDIIIMGYVKSYEKYGLHAQVDSGYEKTHMAFLINKNQAELKQKIDKAINELKQDGTLDKLVAKWCGDLFAGKKAHKDVI